MGPGEPEGLAELTSRAQSNPHDADAWIELALALIESGDTDRAPLALRHAHALSAERPAELVRICHLYRRLDNRVEASNAARRALHLDPDLEAAALAVAALQLESGDPHAAVLSLRVAAHQHPQSQAVRLALAGACLDAGRTQDALRHAERARSAAPDDSRTLALLARAYRQAARSEDEIHVLEDLTNLVPSDVSAVIRLGTLYADRGDRGRSAALLNRLAEHPPKNFAALVELGRALTQAQAFVPAVRCLREAIRIHPDDPRGHQQLGRALHEGGARKEALNSLRTASALAPDDPSIALSLGLCLREAGLLREASAALIRAAAAAPGDQNIQDELADTLALMKTPKDGTRATTPPAPSAVPQGPMPKENTDGSFTGDLAVFSVPELLEFLGNQRATGELQVRSRGLGGSIQLHKGKICGVGYPGGKNLGQLLVEGELVSQTDLKRAVVRVQDLDEDAVVAQAVVGQGLADRTAVQEFLRRRVLEGVSELVSWKDGMILFRRDLEPKTTPDIEIDPRWVLLEALRRLDESNRGD